MESAVLENDFRKDVWTRTTTRPDYTVKAQAPAGWRLTAYERPHLKNQLIRRHIRGISAEIYFIDRIRSARELLRTAAGKKQAEELSREFQTHATKWQSDVRFISSVADMVLHPSYLRIIGMGPPVVPLLLKELQKEPAHWFQALEAITGHNPVEETDRGRVGRMTQRWLDWAKAQHIS